MPGKIYDKNSSKFLTAFNQLEKFLRDQLEDKTLGFSEMVGKWNDLGYLSHNYYRDLVQFARLRNAIVHDYARGKVIAEPSDYAVKRIRQLCQDVCRPKRLHELFNKKIITAGIQDKISEVLSLFWQHKISQIPVVENGKIINVLNTNTISWWFSATHPDNFQVAPIGEVLSYMEHQRNFALLSENAKFPEAVKLFRESYSKVNRGWFMDAILITTNGQPELPIKGIIVLEDLVDHLI